MSRELDSFDHPFADPPHDDRAVARAIIFPAAMSFEPPLFVSDVSRPASGILLVALAGELDLACASMSTPKGTQP